MLEIIDKGQTTDAHPVPLLFVHGGCHAAWCWDEYFLDYFAAQGFRASAVSFRGHGGSSLAKPLKDCTIADYVEDVRSVADSLDHEPVVIGHSLGGFVVQKYLEHREAPAAVLLASAPPQGILGTSMRVWLKHPWVAMRANTFGQAHDLFNTPRMARAHLFTKDTPEDIVAACVARVEPESVRAAFINQLFHLPKTDLITTPVLVLGGQQDGIIANRVVHATARAYGTDATLFPKMGHNMMVDPAWRDVADCIREWLARRQL